MSGSFSSQDSSLISKNTFRVLDKTEIKCQLRICCNPQSNDATRIHENNCILCRTSDVSRFELQTF